MAKKPFPFSVCKECCVSGGSGSGATNIEDGSAYGSVQTINAVAQTENSFAEGNGAIAGGRAFDIVNAVSNNDGTGYIEIQGSTNGLEVGDVFSYQLSNNYDFYGTITSFEDIPGATNTETGATQTHGAIYVDKFTVDTNSSGGSVTTGTLWIPSKPTLGTKLWGTAAHTEGCENISSSTGAHSEGYNNKSGGKYSHTENRDNEAGYAAHAEGQNTKAHAPKSHTEGEGTKVFAEKGHAEGHFGKVTGVAGHAEGWGTETNGKAGHSEGISCITNGDYGHSEGNNTRSNGDYSHAQNRDCIAAGDGSSASGLHTIANGEYQNTQGKFNKEDFSNKYAHIVGNGTAWNKRSNAHTLDWDGNAWFAGNVECTELVMKSPNGTAWKITITDEGTLNVEG